MTNDKDVTFWGWLTQELIKSGYQPYNIVQIVKPKTWEVYDYNKFLTFTNQAFGNSKKDAIYRGNLIFFMFDESQFHYTWKEEYDGEIVYERHLRYIPSLKAIQGKLIKEGATFTSVDVVPNNSWVPDFLCELT